MTNVKITGFRARTRSEGGETIHTIEAITDNGKAIGTGFGLSDADTLSAAEVAEGLRDFADHIMDVEANGFKTSKENPLVVSNMVIVDPVTGKAIS